MSRGFHSLGAPPFHNSEAIWTSASREFGYLVVGGLMAAASSRPVWLSAHSFVRPKYFQPAAFLIVSPVTTSAEPGWLRLVREDA